jgi:hypothetical protein
VAASALFGLGTGRLEDAEELDHPAHEQPLLVDLDPDAGRRGKDDVITGLNGHLDAGLLPPVEPGPDGEHDPLLGRRVVCAGRDDEPGPPHPILIELLDHDLIEQRPKVMPHGLNGLPPGLRIHGVEDIQAPGTHPAEICHTRVLSNDSTEGNVLGGMRAPNGSTEGNLPGVAGPQDPAPTAEPGVSRAIADKVQARPDVIVARRAADEWSVLSLDELHESGLSRDQVILRVHKGWLHRVYRRVYAVGHSSLPMQGRFLAAVKSVGQDAVLSHFAAAALWGFVDWDGRYPK